MGLVNHELAFNLDELRELQDSTGKVCSELSEQRKSLKEGLEQLRKDWDTNGGRYFFKQIDTDWEAEVTKFENTLAVFSEVLADAIEQFEEILEEAKTVKIDLP